VRLEAVERAGRFEVSAEQRAALLERGGFFNQA